MSKPEKKIERLKKLVKKVKFSPPGYMEREWAEIQYLETIIFLDKLYKLQEKK